MAKVISNKRKLNKIDLNNLSQKDRDFLTLDPKRVMKKYKIEQQGVYDRRFALNKKIREAGLSIDEVLNGKQAETAPAEELAAPKKVAAKKAAAKKEAPKKEAPKKESPKKAAPKKEAPKKAAPKKVKQAAAKKVAPAEPIQEHVEEVHEAPVTDIVKYEKSIPVIMKPIEINFETFSIKLNGVPKKIAINPETNSIEIDL